MIHFVSLAVLLVVFLVYPAHAFSPEKDAEALCRAWLEIPEEFETVKTEPCDCILWGSKKDKCGCFYVGTQRYAVANTGGSCSSIDVLKIDSNDYVSDDAIVNVNTNGFSMGLSAKPLSYQGDYFTLLYNSHRQYLLNTDSRTVLCGKVYKFNGWKKAQPEESELCHKFENGKYEIKSIALSVEQQNESRCAATQATHLAVADLDSDRKMETITSYERSSGAGCGCDRKFLGIDIWDNQCTYREVRTVLEEELRSLGGICDKSFFWSVVTINGQDYVLRDIEKKSHLAPKVDGEEYFTSKLAPRMLYVFKQGHFTPICYIDADMSEHIDSDVLKVLDYKPY
tara:strand:+ start:368 stop:1390 length:1023 start_codon:yes stop_codon:yes gene_type:complete